MSTTATPPPKKPPNGTTSTPSTARKAPAASTTSSTAAPLNRSPSRMAANSGTGTGSNTSNASINRTRSVRNGAGTAVSARAAARKPASSDPTASGDEDAKAEMQARLDELQQKLAESEQSLSTAQKQAEVLQIKLDEALKEQSILEDSVQEHTERIEELENEKREALRAKREMEMVFESERAATMKEREEGQIREEEMQRSLMRLKEALAQQRGHGHAGLGEEEVMEGRRHSRPLSISRTSSFRSGTGSPNPEAMMGRESGRQFAPSSSTSLQRSDSRSSSQLVNQKDKIIEGLKLELAEAQIKLVELENKGGANLHLLERDMYEIKMLNARLMEENESFQLLLRDKALSGDFGQPDLLRAPSSTAEDGSRPSSRHPTADRNGASLADELAGEDSVIAIDGDSTGPDSAAPVDSKERRLQSEVNSLKDQNKALTLWINNIISRLLQHDQFEQIFDKTPDLMSGPAALTRKRASGIETEKESPPPPPPKDEKPVEEGQGQSLLQRAGSVLRGRSANKPARPMSQTLAPEQAIRVDDGPTLHENPETAPRIPLGRSSSVRNQSASAHRRANSDWPAASVVTNMYKGPSPALSPGLGSPTTVGRSGSFFPLGARTPSGNVVPTIDEVDATGKENEMPRPPPHRDSKALPQDAGSRQSQRDSGSSNADTTSTNFADSAALSALTGEASSNPSSPPRSTTSSGERDSRAGGAIMMGSKPRPLRLVQESAAKEDEKKAAAGNRGSWFGWMNKAGTAAGPGMGRTVSGGEGQQ